MRHAHDVGVDGERHHPRRALGIAVDLLELVCRPVAVFARRVVLDQHHRDVVAFLGIGDVDDGARTRLEHHGLVVQHPVGDVFIPLLDQDVGGLPGLGQPRAEPAARPPSGAGLDRIGGAADVEALVLDFLQIALGEAVADELPAPSMRRLRDLRVGGHRGAVDAERRGDREFVERLQKAPEPHPVAVFVPRPVGDVGARRSARRRGEHGARHRRLGVPFLDIDDHPDRHARAVRQDERLASGDRVIVDTFRRQHGRSFVGVSRSTVALANDHIAGGYLSNVAIVLVGVL